MTITTSDQILDAALKLFAEKGLHATPTSAITKLAGVSTGLLFHHFGGKDELIVALYVREKLKLYYTLSGVNVNALTEGKKIADGTEVDEGEGVGTNVPVRIAFQNPSFYQQVREKILGTFDWMLSNADALRFILQIYPTPYRPMAERDPRLLAARSGVEELLKSGKNFGVFKPLPEVLLDEIVFYQLVAMVEYVQRNPDFLVDDVTKEMLFQTIWQSVTN